MTVRRWLYDRLSMSVATETPSHREQVEALIGAAEELAGRVSHTAAELAEDGGQPRFIAALNELESMLTAEGLRLGAALAGGTRTDQQELTV